MLAKGSFVTDQARRIQILGAQVDAALGIKDDRRDDKGVTQAALKTTTAFLNTEGGDLLLGVADGGSVVGVELDQLESDDKFMRHLAGVQNSMGDRAGTCIDPKTQIVQGKPHCGSTDAGRAVNNGATVAPIARPENLQQPDPSTRTQR